MGFYSVKKANRLILANLAAIIIITAALLVGIYEGLNIYTRHGQSIVLPSLKGMSVDDAVKLLQDKGLNVEVSDSTYAPGKPADCVLAQNPIPGEPMKAGRTVYLTINSLSVPMQNVPDVINKMHEREATAALLSAGFKLTEDEHTDGDRDLVCGIKINGRSLMPGESAPAGATLTLVIGNGYHPQSDMSDTSLVEQGSPEDNPMDEDVEDVAPDETTTKDVKDKTEKVKEKKTDKKQEKKQDNKPEKKKEKKAEKADDNSWF